MSYRTVPLMFSNASQGKASLDYIWLELTSLCNLTCTHCYADSGPSGTHGRMEKTDWERILTEAASLNCSSVTFIGGEPTVHPALPQLIEKAASLGLVSDVFTNLIRVTDKLWDVFSKHRVILSTSFYSIDPFEHDKITGRLGSQERTLTNIKKALDLGIDIGVGLTLIHPEQHLDETIIMLQNLGVVRITTDHQRAVGRGCKTGEPNEAALCGSCAGPSAVINQEGNVFPCIMSKWLPVGNVKTESFTNILNGADMLQAKTHLDNCFSAASIKACNPNQFPCPPQSCCPSYIRRVESSVAEDIPV